MVPFKYEQVSGALMAELEEKLSAGESLVLLGPRYAGKRHVMNHLQEVVKKRGETPVRLKFLSDAVIDSEREVRKLLEQAIEQAIGGNGAGRPAGRPEHPIFAPLDAVCASPHSGRRVFLFASNIDSMAHHVARRFLEGLNRRVPPGRLIVVLSGEQDLSNLARSPKGEVDFGHKYVLQNCDRAQFEHHMMQYLGETNLSFESPKDAVEKLYRLAGGNLYAMRMVLWGLLEARARRGNHPVGVEEIPEALNFIGIPTIYGAHVFRHGTQLIACDPDCWDDLETLIKRGEVEVAPGKPTPGTLEMAGVAVLHPDPGQSSARLRFASQLQKDFVTKHYDARRFGDLYAGHGDWGRAFAYYAGLPSSARIRPAGVEDLAQVEGAVRSLCSSFYVEATHHPLRHTDSGRKRRIDPDRNMNAIRERFTRGGEYLLGFREISFWERASSQSEEGWQLMPKWGLPPKEKEQRIIASFLPTQDPAPSGIWEPPPQHRQYAIAMIIDPPSVNRQIAVVLSDLEQRDEISRERARLSKMMLRDLAWAYIHAEEVNYLNELRWLREKQVRIMNSIFDSLGSHGVRDVLKKAADGLVKLLGYRRALFSLVDPGGEWVRGVQETSDDPSVNMESYVKAPLRDDDNLHAYVIHNRKTVRVADARKEPRADAFFVKKGKVKACALIPLISPAERAIGTLHVERAGGAVPTDQEVEDLESFGKQLAVAIEQIERVNLLETSLDKIPEPMVIVDRTGRRRYANRPAATLLGLTEGWNRNPDQPPLSEELAGAAGNVTELLGESLRERRRLSSHHKGIGREPEYRGVVLTDFIEDWRGQVSGGFLHIQDFNYLQRIFEAAQIIGAASDFTSAMRHTLEAMKHLGHRWGRLYRVEDDGRNPPRLVSHLSYGYEDPEWAQKFSEGKFVTERGRPGFIDWSCIERGEPLVFCWKEGLEPGDLHTTSYGLKAINTPTPGQPDEIRKRPGDFWIDFPLITPDRVLGKVSLQCDESLRPEEFELLKVLCEVATFIVRESSNVAYEKNALREAALKTVGTMAHNLVTRFGVFSPLGGRYKLLEGKYEELKPINKDYFDSLDGAVKIAERAKNLLGVIRPVKTEFDLVAHLRRVLPPSMPEGKLRVTADCEELEVVADGQLLGTALLEMIQNSKDALPDPEALEVTVHVESRTPDLLAGDWVRIIVSDNGPGIPPEIHDRVFNEFFTYRPGREPGTGFGLDFVSRVVKAHEGYYGVLAPRGGAELFIMISRRPRGEAPTGEENAYVVQDTDR